MKQMDEWFLRPGVVGDTEAIGNFKNDVVFSLMMVTQL